MPKYPVVIVEWIDTSFYGKENDISWLKDNAKTLNMNSVGFLLQKDKSQIVITAELSEFKDARATSVIPQKAIKRIIYLKEQE